MRLASEAYIWIYDLLDLVNNILNSAQYMNDILDLYIKDLGTVRRVLGMEMVGDRLGNSSNYIGSTPRC